MPSSKSVTMYHDVRLVLDAAIAAGGGTYTLPTHGKAVHWRQRAYNYRKLIRDAKIAATLIPGLDPTTPYDTIELILEPHSCSVIIRPIEIKGVLTNTAGATISLTAPIKQEHSDELSAVALDLLSRHGG